MRKLVAIGAAALLMLAVAVPLATAGTTTTPKSVTGSFIGTYTGGDGTYHVMFRFEVRTDASGAVTFGYYQQQPLGSSEAATIAVVDSARFYRTASGAKAAELRLTECNPDLGAGECNDQAIVVVTDGATDTFAGGTPSEPSKYPYSVDDGNIAIAMGGQNGQ